VRTVNNLSVVFVLLVKICQNLEAREISSKHALGEDVQIWQFRFNLNFKYNDLCIMIYLNIMIYYLFLDYINDKKTRINLIFF